MAIINIYAASIHGTASDVAQLALRQLQEAGHQTTLFEPPALADLRANNAEVLLFISSTTGQGELPDDMQAFVYACRETMPLQTGKKYAVIGLGDSTFDDFCAAERHLDELALELGAERLGANLKIDASIDFDAQQPALHWLQAWLALL